MGRPRKHKTEEERKAAKRERDKAWRVANKVHIAASRAAWRGSNRERIAATDKAWREANKERKAASNKARYAAAGVGVYVVAHPAFPGAVKIGRASSGFKGRLTSLNTGCPRRAYTMPFTLRTGDDAKAVEAKAHAALARWRLEGEWFGCSAAEAVSAVSLAKWGPTPGVDVEFED